MTTSALSGTSNARGKKMKDQLPDQTNNRMFWAKPTIAFGQEKFLLNPAEQTAVLA